MSAPSDCFHLGDIPLIEFVLVISFERPEANHSPKCDLCQTVPALLAMHTSIRFTKFLKVLGCWLCGDGGGAAREVGRLLADVWVVGGWFGGWGGDCPPGLMNHGSWSISIKTINQ